jgi:hypothetical protein
MELTSSACFRPAASHSQSAFLAVLFRVLPREGLPDLILAQGNWQVEAMLTVAALTYALPITSNSNLATNLYHLVVRQFEDICDTNRIPGHRSKDSFLPTRNARLNLSPPHRLLRPA